VNGLVTGTVIEPGFKDVAGLKNHLSEDLPVSRECHFAGLPGSNEGLDDGGQIEIAQASLKLLFAGVGGKVLEELDQTMSQYDTKLASEAGVVQHEILKEVLFDDQELCMLRNPNVGISRRVRKDGQLSQAIAPTQISQWPGFFLVSGAQNFHDSALDDE
jgi:hypothetical protein